MSSLQVDSISSMGGGHVDGAGKVVQYQETYNAKSPAISGKITSWVSAGIDVDISPKFIGSKLVVYGNISMSNVSNGWMEVTLFKNGGILRGSDGSAAERIMGYAERDVGAQAPYNNLTGSYVETVTDTSTVSFGIYYRVGASTTEGFPVHNGASYILSATEIAQ